MQQPYLHGGEADEVDERRSGSASLSDRCTDVSSRIVRYRGANHWLVPLLDEVVVLRSSLVVARTGLLVWQAS